MDGAKAIAPREDDQRRHPVPAEIPRVPGEERNVADLNRVSLIRRLDTKRRMLCVRSLKQLVLHLFLKEMRNSWLIIMCI